MAEAPHQSEMAVAVLCPPLALLIAGVHYDVIDLLVHLKRNLLW